MGMLADTKIASEALGRETISNRYPLAPSYLACYWPGGMVILPLVLVDVRLLVIRAAGHLGGGRGAVQRGDVLGDRYRLDTVIGRGGMGEVWRGFDLRLQRPVAVKVVVPTGTAKDPQALARFLREGLAAAQLDHHPVIAAVYDADMHQGEPFLVLELLRGNDLAAVLAGSPGGLEIDLVLSFGTQIAEGLAAAHAAGIVHRDIKPSNLMVLPGGRIKICDFGIAYLQDKTTALTFTGQAIGTPAYMAPEQWAGREVDERADLYSLGCVLYELLTGKRPFYAGKPPAALPSGLGNLLMRLLAQHPVQRVATAAAAAAELRAIAARYQKAAEALDARISGLLAEVEHIARARSPMMKTDLLIRIAEIAAKSDPGKGHRLLAEAERTGRTLDGSSARYALEDIAVVMAALDPAAAVQIARSLDDPSSQAETLKNAAKAIKERDPVTAAQLLTDAEEVVRTIPKPGQRCAELCQLAEATGELDPDRALAILAEAERVSRSLSDPWEQARALGWWIAEPAARLDPGYGRRLLADAEELARAVTDPSNRVLALKLIAQVMAGLDLPEAERIAQAITDVDDQVTGLLKVTKVAAERDPDTARQLLGAVQRVIRTMDDPWAVSRRLEELAEIAASLDLDEAESIARSISDGEERGEALVKTAKGIGQDLGKVSGLLDEARDALGIVRNESGAKVLSEIAEVIAERDPERACGMLREAVQEQHARVQRESSGFGNPLPELAKGMAKIANVVARRDIARAERIARSIDDEYVRRDALGDIAARVALWDPAGAVRIVGTLDHGTDEAMVRVIEVIAGRDRDEAERIARNAEFANALRGADALLAVATALAQQDPHRNRPVTRYGASD
jgi:serine/threonine protein kinase